MTELPGSMARGEQGELNILRSIRNRAEKISQARVALGIGDDCALLRPGRGEEVAVTTDLSIAERHFRLDWHPPESVGHRTLARGLSDLAAMGAQPVAAFLSLALPLNLTRAPGRRTGQSWLDRFLDGFLALAAQHGVVLAGGDLAESSLALADIVLTGVVPRGVALLRSGARVGDHVCVTGTLGGAAAELTALAAHPRRFARLRQASGVADEPHPHLYPLPRIAQGMALRRRRLATAALDISDGLSTELAHLAAASGVRIEIDAARIPLGPGATLDQALHGGEDYELLFTAPERGPLPRTIAGVPVTRIGRVLASDRRHPAVLLLDGERRCALSPRGWEHFR
jgi:thiamine-monophosphate kinase